MGMTKYESRKAGGIAAAKAVRDRYVKQYNQNPNHCLFCGEVIKIGVGQKTGYVKKKKFCSRSCASKYNNKFLRGYTLKDEIKKKEKTFKIDESVLIEDLLGKGSSKYALIRSKARAKMNFYGIEKRCIICGYTLHVEVHHIKPCNTYNIKTPLSVVNDLSNLVYLCPNHHYEADNNLLHLGI